METLTQDTRHCANAGCNELATREYVAYLAEGKTRAYCSCACQEQHGALLIGTRLQAMRDRGSE